MDRKKLLILGSTPEYTLQIVQYAKSIGVHTIVTDYYPPERTEAKNSADEAWMISVAELDLLEEECRKAGVTAVMCGVDEFCQDMVIELCERLGFPCYCTKEAWQYNRNKALFKKACREVGLPVATDYTQEDILAGRVEYPVVVKPVDQNSNVGISFCHSEREALEAIRLAKAVSKKGQFLIEKMLHGDEIWCTYAMAQGEVSRNNLMGIYHDTNSSSQIYSVLTSVTRHKKQYLQEIDGLARALFKHIGCKEGLGFIQFIRNQADGRIYALEMGYRMAGSLDYLATEKVNRFNAVKWMTDYALGVRNSPKDLPKDTEEMWTSCPCSYILWSKQPGVIGEIGGFDQIERELSPIATLQYHLPGYEVHAGSYEMILSFVAKDCDELCDTIERINRLAVMNSKEGEDLLVRFTDFDTLRQNYREGLLTE